MSSLHWPGIRHSLQIAGVALALGAPPAAVLADDAGNDPEREALAALTRQLDLVDRLAAHAAAAAPEGAARYHFDYARLHTDVARMRAGVHDYLAPQRAQPRDPLPLAGDYAHEADSREQEAP